MKPIRQITIFSPSGIKAGFGVSQRYVALAHWLTHAGFQVTVMARGENRSRSSPWKGTGVFQWIKAIVQSQCFILSPATPVLPLILLSLLRKKTIIDYYGPDFIEMYEKFRSDNFLRSRVRYALGRRKLLLLLSRSDLILVSSESLTTFLKGILFERGFLSPSAYSNDPGFDRRFCLLPYGYSPASSVDGDDSGSNRNYEIDFEVPTLIWGGGLWNWFDPFTVVKALQHLKERNLRIQALFPGGTVHPGHQSRMHNQNELQKRVEEYGLQDRVFFSSEHIPYRDFLNLASRCLAGLSVSKRAIENLLSYRTRVVTYVGAGIPTIATRGDPLSDFVERNHIGVVVDPGNHLEMADAIRKLAEDAGFRDACRKQVREVQKSFTWENLCKPLVVILQNRTFPKRPRHPMRSLALTLGYACTRLLFILLNPQAVIARFRPPGIS